MNVTTWRRECPADLGLAIPGPAEKVVRAAMRRPGKSMMPGIALSAVIHAGVLAVRPVRRGKPLLQFSHGGRRWDRPGIPGDQVRPVPRTATAPPRPTRSGKSRSINQGPPPPLFRRPWKRRSLQKRLQVARCSGRRWRRASPSNPPGCNMPRRLRGGAHQRPKRPGGRGKRAPAARRATRRPCPATARTGPPSTRVRRGSGATRAKC